MIQLSKRLSAIAKYVPSGSVLADIGTDHALLPVYLAQQGMISQAVAGDLNPGPVLAAERQVKGAGLEQVVSVRAGDGLSVLTAADKIGVVVIAGMGGGTIAEMLAAGAARLAGVGRLILQPNVGERKVREWLLNAGWKLSAEQLLEEDGLLYEILVADADVGGKAEADRWNARLYGEPLPGAGNVPVQLRLLMGPYLIAEANELFMRKWSAYADKLALVAGQVGKSKQVEARRKRDALLAERSAIQEVLACLSK